MLATALLCLRLTVDHYPDAWHVDRFADGVVSTRFEEARGWRADWRIPLYPDGLFDARRIEIVPNSPDGGVFAWIEAPYPYSGWRQGVTICAAPHDVLKLPIVARDAQAP